MHIFISMSNQGDFDEILKKAKTIRKELVRKLKIPEANLICADYLHSNVELRNSKENNFLALSDLIESLSRMEKCGVVVMVGDWKKSRGRRFEYEIAKAYGKPILIL